MANLNNIEKLIQMATIEHMYEMLQKIKNDITLNQLSDTIFDSSRCSNNFLPPDDDNYKNEVKNINDTISIIKSDNANMMKIIDTILMKIYSLESEIKELKTKNDTLSSEINKMRNSESSTGGGHITLKIEEKNIDTSVDLAKNTDEMMDKIKQLEEEVEEEDVEEEEDEEQVEDQEEEEVEDQEEEVEDQEEEAEDQEEEEDEQQEEEEVGTDDEEDVEQKELKKEEQHESLEEDDEDEEVFEIEIDDITYFTTDEENGILYEVTSDGEVGKKVGIIKNGEPIFS
jgi:DNA repair exonuclease SbcCD ATPase subunit